MLTRPLLSTLWPRARPGKIDAIVAVAPAIFAEHGLTTPQRVAHVLAQISHENGAGTIVRENLNYKTPQRLFEIYGVGHHSAKVTAAEAQQLVGKPQALAERVYGLGNPKKARELGNTQPGDGYRYRGNGDLQLTGRESHAKIGAAIGVDLVNNPEQLEDPAASFRCAVAEFASSGCVPAADADDVYRVTLLVNGGTNGLPERTAWLQRWKAALEAENAQPEEAPVEQVEEALAADAMPRGAEVKEPKVSPEAASGGALVSGAGAGGIDEIAKQIQTEITPLTYMFSGMKMIFAILMFACICLAVYGSIKRFRNSKRV